MSQSSELISKRPAFDSIEWDYLAKVLNVFNFKEDFKIWIQILYADILSCVINDGFASPFFKVKSWCTTRLPVIRFAFCPWNRTSKFFFNLFSFVQYGQGYRNS